MPDMEDDTLISQDDIDKLLDSSGAADDEEDTEAADDIGDFSQDDIDSLFNAGDGDAGGGPDPSGSSDGETAEPTEETEDDLDFISREDIQRVVTGKADGDTTEPPGAGEETETGDDEISAPQNTENPPAAPPADEIGKAAAGGAADEGDIIEASEAVAIEDSLVAQETVDNLIKAEQDMTEPENDDASHEEETAEEAPVSESGENDPGEPAETGSQADMVSDEDPEPEQDREVSDAEAGVTVVDLDDDEDEAGGEDSAESGGEAMADIDSLLDDTEGEDENDFQPDDLVAQEDIEALIKSTEQENEDILGDVQGDGADEEMDSDTDADEDKAGDTEDNDPAGGEQGDAGGPAGKKGASEKIKGIKPRRKTVVAVSAAVFACLIVLAGYFLFFPLERQTADSGVQVAKPVPGEETSEEVQSVDIDLEEKAAYSTEPRKLALKDFLIMAPEQSENLAYIRADISIDYSDKNVYNSIKAHTPFYRDIIYTSIRDALDSEKGDKVTEADLAEIVNKALQDALPEESIKKVSFSGFKAG